MGASILGGMDLSWIDLVGGGLIALFLVLGFVRGLWWQVIRALGLIAAVLVARAASPRVTPWIAEPPAACSATLRASATAMFCTKIAKRDASSAGDA